MTQRSDVLIDASNLHVGGGVQVAASALVEFMRMRRDPQSVAQHPWLRDVAVELSSAVRTSVPDTDLPDGWVVVDRRPLRPTAGSDAVADGRGSDVRFTVFGPSYRRRRARREILGYADVTSLHPWPEGLDPRPWRAALISSVRSRASRRWLRRADRVVVESAAMKDAAVGAGALPAAVSVVPNTYNATFDAPQEWGPPLDLPDFDGYTFCYVTRAYPHKNLRFVGELIDVLAARGLAARCLTTLTDEEWSTALDDRTREACVNVGPLAIQQVPRVYEASQAVLFPSLLEAFSATPLEGLKMGKVVFASDRSFVRATCGEAVVYIDPLDAASSAATVLEVVEDQSVQQGLLARGEALLAAHPGARERAEAYAEIITKECAQ